MILYGKDVTFSTLVGLTLTSVVNNGDIVFTTTDGRVFRQTHHQDCCESVSVEDVCGDLEDLVGSPILRAEERTSDEPPEGSDTSRYRDDAETWTFYEIATIKGSVTIRWFGSSNGYYSTSVSFEETT